MIIIKENNKFKTIKSQCFPKSALILHFIKLSNFEKKMLKNATLAM